MTTAARVSQPRVLLACSWFLKYTASLARELAALGLPTALLCRDVPTEFAGRRDELDACVESVRRAGVDVFSLPGRSSEPGAWARAWQLRRAIRSWGPEVVHVQDNYDPRLLVACGSLRPRLVTVHDPVPHDGQERKRRWRHGVRRRWISQAATLVVHGEALRRQLLGPEGERQVSVIPHGSAAAELPCELPPSPCVLFFGRLEPYKGLGVLQRAMDQVWAERPDARLVIAGQGQAVREVRRDDPRIELRAGYILERELDPLFAAASLVVLPYTEASQSGVASLSLARGIPTIVSDVGALAESVPDPRFVVEPGRPRELADRILGLLGHDMELRQEVLRFAQAELSWRRSARMHADLYARVIESGEPC